MREVRPGPPAKTRMRRRRDMDSREVTSFSENWCEIYGRQLYDSDVGGRLSRLHTMQLEGQCSLDVISHAWCSCLTVKLYFN